MSRTRTQWQELAVTTNDGAAAVLLWDESNRLRVALMDEWLCHYVDFQIPDEVQGRALWDAIAGREGETT